MTAQLIAAQSAKPLEPSDVAKLLEGLLHYLKVHRTQKPEAASNLEQSIDEVI